MFEPLPHREQIKGAPTKRCKIAVHFEDGTTRVLMEDGEPAWRTGDRVKVTNGIIGAT